MLKTAANPEGLPIEVFDGLRASLVKDRSQFYKDLAIQFYGANRPGAKVSQGLLDQFWLWSMQAGLKNAYESIKAFSETDFTEDLKKFDVPTLVLHGEDDQIVPVKDSARKSARLIKGAKDIYYPGAPHGITATHQDQVNAELLAFLRAIRHRYKETTMLKRLSIVPLALASIVGVSAAQSTTAAATTPVRNIVLVHGASRMDRVTRRSFRCSWPRASASRPSRTRCRRSPRTSRRQSARSPCRMGR